MIKNSFIKNLFDLVSYVIQKEKLNITYIITTLSKITSTKISKLKLVNFLKNVKRKLT
jgi:hypothetical protein